MKSLKRKRAALIIGFLFCLFGTLAACRDNDSKPDSSLISSSSVATTSSSHSSQAISESSALESRWSFLETSSSEVYSSENSEFSSEGSSLDASSSEIDLTESSISSDSTESSLDKSSETLENSEVSSQKDSSSQELHVHVFKDSVYKEPTCEETGILMKTCIGCQHYETEEIPALDHKEAVNAGYPSTCKEKGKTDGTYCERCKITLIAQEDLPLVDHSFEDHVCKWCQHSSLFFELHTSGTYYICTGSEEEIIRFLKVPAQYKGKPVQVIAENAFSKHVELIYVELPDTIVSIGDGAFADCFNITEVCNKSNKIDSSKIFDYGDLFIKRPYVYSDASQTRIATDEAGFITYKDENNNITMIGYCGTETELIIPNSINAIKPYIFSKIKGLKSVFISENIEYLASLTFTNCFDLEKVVIGSGVKEIAQYLFGYSFDSPLQTISPKLTEIVFEETEGWSILELDNISIPSSYFSNYAKIKEYFCINYIEFSWIRE